MQPVDIQNLTDDWLILGYGWDSDNVVYDYLVSVPTGNVFFLSEIATRTTSWNVDSGESRVFVHGDLAYILGHPWNEEISERDWNTTGIYQVHLSSSEEVSGTTLVEYPNQVRSSISSFLPLSSGVILFTSPDPVIETHFIRFTDGSLIVTDIATSGAFTAGQPAFLYHDQDEYGVHVLGEAEPADSSLAFTQYSHSFINGIEQSKCLPVGDQHFLVGSGGILDLTSYRTGIPVVDTFDYEQVVIAVAYDNEHLAVHYLEGDRYGLELINTATWTHDRIFVDNEFLFTEMIASDGILYMTGTSLLNGKSVIVTYDGTTLETTIVGEDAGPLILTPL